MTKGSSLEMTFGYMLNVYMRILFFFVLVHFVISWDTFCSKTTA